MPKVTEEYIANKKKMIVQAAYELCLEKTVSTVAMQDIINRTGLSQGGIYRFYHDIDEIFADMLVEIRKKVYIREKVDEIFEKAEELPAGEVTFRIFDMLAEFMSEELMGVEKIDFELSVLAMNAPDRVEKILAGAGGVGHKEYIMLRTSEFFKKRLESGEMQMKVNEAELLTYISSAFSGIQMCCIVNNCYHKGPMAEFYQPERLLRTMGKTVNYLLGIEGG
ncbi:MAG: TetR/AcrR family transcriptional regulator [Lachnospiraceae bacterium]|nr:TetR/AcrR family transcriptional regulator [Lachnospiraceae bacterium]